LWDILYTRARARTYTAQLEFPFFTPKKFAVFYADAIDSRHSCGVQ